MIKSDLTYRILRGNPHLHLREVVKVVDAILEEIILALERGDRVELRGFGAFSVRERGARIGRNPRSGVQVVVPEKIAPHFRMAKEMQKRLNPNDAQ